MIETIADLPDNVAGFTASGTVSAEDYETVLIPEIEAKLKAHGRVRLLYHLAADLEGFTAGAVWDDTKVGLLHLFDYDRIAVVSDAEWILKSVRLFGFMMPCEVGTFTEDRFAEARAWISA